MSNANNPLDKQPAHDALNAAVRECSAVDNDGVHDEDEFEDDEGLAGILANGQADAKALESHAVAEAFPPMQGAAFAKLVESIRVNGQRQPIMLAPGGKTIVDGLTRWRACLEAGVEPWFETLDASFDEWAIIQYILDANLNRRDLTTAQRALIAAETIEPALKAAAKQRQREHGGTAPGKPSTLLMNSAQVNGTRAPTARAQAAKQAGVGEDSVAKAHRILEHPDLKEKVAAGEMSMPSADKIARQRTAVQDDDQAPATTTKFIQVSKAVSPLAGWWWEPLTAGLDSLPVFHPERLLGPAITWRMNSTYSDPRMGRVAVCPGTDLYHPAVSEEFITRIHAACTATPAWQYFLLSNFPERIAGRKDLPPLACVGVHVFEQKDAPRAEQAFKKLKGVKAKWLLVQPQQEITFTDLSMFDWVVVTAQPEVFTPSFDWLARLYIDAKDAGCAVWFAPNLQERLELPQEEPNLTSKK